MDEGVSGLLCKVKDAGSLEERERMGIAARKKMERQFDKKVVVKNTIDAVFSSER